MVLVLSPRLQQGRYVWFVNRELSKEAGVRAVQANYQVTIVRQVELRIFVFSPPTVSAIPYTPKIAELHGTLLTVNENVNSLGAFGGSKLWTREHYCGACFSTRRRRIKN